MKILRIQFKFLTLNKLYLPILLSKIIQFMEKDVYFLKIYKEKLKLLNYNLFKIMALEKILSLYI